MAINVSFEDRLAQERKTEKLIAAWFMSRGWFILPVYDYSEQDKKAPKLTAFDVVNSLVTPDLLIARDGDLKWVEIKRKTEAVFYRKAKQWRTGIAKRLWRDYQDVEKLSGQEVWLVFIHEDRDEVVGAHIAKLTPIDQEHNLSGYSNMVYFWLEEFKLIAKISDIRRDFGHMVKP